MAEIGDLLSTDPIKVAESMMGKSCRDDAATAELGFQLYLEHAQQTRQALDARGDSHHASPFQSYVQLVEQLGFELLSTEQFMDVEQYRIYWRQGLLLQCESYGGINGSVNAASIYFNARFHNSADAFKMRLSGRYEQSGLEHNRYIWVGDFDAREALKFQLQRLETRAIILPRWIEAPFLWLHTYGEKDAEQFDELTKQRIERFPALVKRAIRK